MPFEMRTGAVVMIDALGFKGIWEHHAGKKGGRPKTGATRKAGNDDNEVRVRGDNPEQASLERVLEQVRNPF